MLISFVAVSAQTVTPSVPQVSTKDTVAEAPQLSPVADTSSQYHSPLRASIMSMALPGLGQVYNKKYWKVPIIYGAGLASLYFAVENGKRYNAYKDAYDKVKEDENISSATVYGGQYSQEQLKYLRDEYRRDLDLGKIGVVFVYLLNIIDANVDAHFYHFDVNEDLSLEIKPSFDVNNYSASFGVSLGVDL